MDNYFKFDKDYSTMTDAQRDAFVARYNVRDGGIIRLGFDNGGVSSIFGNPDQLEYEEFMKKRSRNIITFESNLAKRLMNKYDLDSNTASRYAGTINFYVNSNPRMLSGKEKILEEGYLGNNEIILKEIENKDNINSFAIEKSKGGIIRLGFSDGTKKPRAYEVLIDKEGLAKEAEERADRINKLAEKISKEKGISFSDALEQAIAIITPNTFSNDGKTNIDELDESPVTRAEKMANYKAFSKLLDYGRQFPPFLKSIPIKYNKLIDDFETMQKERFMYDSPKMKKGGLMNIPVRTNSEGIKELDMRKTGGFVPIGVKEKADDVPAMLSKNEFVMTADAVRAAGGGSINKGAQRMYDTMKKLESRIA